MLDAKLLKPLSCVQTTTALRAVNIIGTFEKRAPDYETNKTYATEPLNIRTQLNLSKC